MPAQVMRTFSIQAVPDAILNAVVAAVEDGVKKAKKSGSIQRLELTKKGYRQDLVFGELFVIPSSVCSSAKDFPAILLKSSLVHGLSAEEAVEFKFATQDGNAKLHAEVLKRAKDLFKNKEGKDTCLLAFAPTWGHYSSFRTFPYEPETVTAVLQNLVFAAPVNPALSSVFDQIKARDEDFPLKVVNVPHEQHVFNFASENVDQPDLEKGDAEGKKKNAAKVTKCVDCDKSGEVSKMKSNPVGAGYLCGDCYAKRKKEDKKARFKLRLTAATAEDAKSDLISKEERAVLDALESSIQRGIKGASAKEAGHKLPFGVGSLVSAATRSTFGDFSTSDPAEAAKATEIWNAKSREIWDAAKKDGATDDEARAKVDSFRKEEIGKLKSGSKTASSEDNVYEADKQIEVPGFGKLQVYVRLWYDTPSDCGGACFVDAAPLANTKVDYDYFVEIPNTGKSKSIRRGRISDYDWSDIHDMLGFDNVIAKIPDTVPVETIAAWYKEQNGGELLNSLQRPLGLEASLVASLLRAANGEKEAALPGQVNPNTGRIVPQPVQSPTAPSNTPPAPPKPGQPAQAPQQGQQPQQPQAPQQGQQGQQGQQPMGYVKQMPGVAPTEEEKTSAAGTKKYYRVRDGKSSAIVEVTTVPGKKQPIEKVYEIEHEEPNRGSTVWRFDSDAEYLGTKPPAKKGSSTKVAGNRVFIGRWTGNLRDAIRLIYVHWAPKYSILVKRHNSDAAAKALIDLGDLSSVAETQEETYQQSYRAKGERGSYHSCMPTLDYKSGIDSMNEPILAVWVTSENKWMTKPELEMFIEDGAADAKADAVVYHEASSIPLPSVVATEEEKFAARKYKDYDSFIEGDGFCIDLGSAFDLWMGEPQKKKMWDLYQSGHKFVSKVFDFDGDKDAFWTKVDAWKKRMAVKGYKDFDDEENGDQHEFILVSTAGKQASEFDVDEDYDDEPEIQQEPLYFRVTDYGCTAVIKLELEGGQWRESLYSTEKGDPSNLQIGGSTYMSYLTPQDLLSWLNRDYQQVEMLDGAPPKRRR